MKKIQYINRDLLSALAEQAIHSERRRLNHNFHQPEDLVNRMLNAIEPDSYVRPHRHKSPPKEETFIILQGKGAILIFEEDGSICEVFPLDPTESKWGVDIPAGAYHTVVSLVTETIYFEVKAGPYVPITDKDFAPWAPPEKTAEAMDYLKQLRIKASPA
ncbi:MAG: WbuC family cupin fold metalloprotein [SAR324 cluster bacterium]|nr:WbuC family cupin fold metalloprotein [SAR324 cluster bacterium]